MYVARLARLMVWTMGASLLLCQAAVAAPGDIIARIGPGGGPQWSPDGRHLAFLYDGYLMVAPADGSGLRTKLVPYPHLARRFVWASDTEIVYSERPSRASDTLLFKSITFQRPVDSRGKTLGIVNVAGPILITQAHGDEQAFERTFGPVKLPPGAVGYFRTKGSILGPVRFVPLRIQARLTPREQRWPKIIIRKEGERFSPLWGELWLSTVSDIRKKGHRLTDDELFGLVEVAPTGDKLIALSLGRQAWVVLDTTGREINGRFEPQGIDKPSGLMKSAVSMKWSPDGKRLCYLRTWDDGDYLHDVRLVVSDLSNTKVVELLGYADHGDMGGHEWAPSGTAIAVSTEKSGILVVEVGP